MEFVLIFDLLIISVIGLFIVNFYWNNKVLESSVTKKNDVRKTIIKYKKIKK